MILQPNIQGNDLLHINNLIHAVHIPTHYYLKESQKRKESTLRTAFVNFKIQLFFQQILPGKECSQVKLFGL